MGRKVQDRYGTAKKRRWGRRNIVSAGLSHIQTRPPDNQSAIRPERTVETDVGRKPPPILLNVVGVSGDPKIVKALSKAAHSLKQSVPVFQLGADLSELPALLEEFDEALYTLVFLDHPPVPDPELLQAAEQIYRKAPKAEIWIMAKKDPQKWPEELFKAQLIALLTPPFEWTLFHRLIQSATCYTC